MDGLQTQFMGSETNATFEEVTKESPNQLVSQAKLVYPTAETTLSALLGSPSPGNMRVLGRINSQELTILIDIGSTHNFLDTSVWL